MHNTILQKFKITPSHGKSYVNNISIAFNIMRFKKKTNKITFCCCVLTNFFFLVATIFRIIAYMKKYISRVVILALVCRKHIPGPHAQALFWLSSQLWSSRCQWSYAHASRTELLCTDPTPHLPRFQLKLLLLIWNILLLCLMFK